MDGWLKVGERKFVVALIRAGKETSCSRAKYLIKHNCN